MRLTYRDPFENMWQQVRHLQGEVNRLTNRWGTNGGLEWTRAGGQPALNAWEDQDTLHVEAELPGFSMNDLEILVTGGNQLTIKGERKPVTPDKGVWHRQERGYGSFVRTLTLPYSVDPDKVEARLEHGILSIHLPKHESAKPRKIAVKAEQ